MYKNILKVLVGLTLISVVIIYYNISDTSYNKHIFRRVNGSNLECSVLKSTNILNEQTDALLKWRPIRNILLYDNYIQNQCDRFLFNQKYILKPSNKEELDFPIAFSFVVFKEFQQVERLFRLIYRPWNYYCFHVDIKSDSAFYTNIDQLVTCLNNKYNNIVNTPNRVDVRWGEMSVLDADLNCMRELYKRYSKWKYFINLTGQEFPLKTNWELVQILKAYNGANNLEGTVKRRNENRIPTAQLKWPIIWHKGSVHITVNREFVHVVLYDHKAKAIYNALTGYPVPDETFFATINFNGKQLFNLRGSYVGNADDPEFSPPHDPLYYFLTRYKNWGQYPCHSNNNVRGICIWGVLDIPSMIKQPHLFANKFYEDFQPAALYCMEQFYYEKIHQEFVTRKVAVNQSYYKNLPFVRNQYIPKLNI